MSNKPEIAALISSYQRPGHLRRTLLSIALQRGVAGRFEVVVTDDGSTDETPELVRQFARSVDFPVRFTTHEHVTFQLARCRNEGVAASTAPYLLFLDGDCILPPDHLAIHLARRQQGVVRVGNFVRLDRAASEKIDEASICRGDYLDKNALREGRRLRNKGRRALIYEWLRHPTRPKMVGNNVGIWRCDYERVNGYDENFEGFGWEDEDLGRRLRRAGLRIRSILPYTTTYHLWHHVDPTHPSQTGQQRKNEIYMNQQGRLTRCRNGLVKRPWEDLRLRVVGGQLPPPVAKLLARFSGELPDNLGQRPEVEIAISPGAEKFSGQAECNVLLALDDTPQTLQLARTAHVVVADKKLDESLPRPHFRLQDFPEALKAVA